MASHWPVIVGINQYQFLQPLLYAQFDAIELKDFLVNEAGLAPQYCSLLTDISPMVYQGAAFPTQEVILQRLTQSCEQAGEDDTVWFFFSGYGVHWQGQDYILPIDADSNQITQTGIRVEDIFNILKRGANRQALVILDMNRPQAALASQNLGIQSLELAKNLALPLILSCQPQQFSQESLAVRHGLFTEAMIEGMRFHGCLTLAQLAAYLSDRVPELCQHHWRPEQNPAMVIPAEQQFLMLVPPSAAGQISGGDLPASLALWPNREDSQGPTGYPPAPPIERPEIEVNQPAFPPSGLRPVATVPAPLPEVVPPIIDVSPPISTIAQEAETVPGSGWQRWLLAAAGVLLVGVLLRNQTIFWGRGPTAPDSEAVIAPAAPAPTMAPEAEGEAAPARADGDLESLFPNAEGAPAATALEQARLALEQQQFGEALTWLNQVPEDQRPEDYAALVDQAQGGSNSSSITGEEALAEARRVIDPLPASLFSDAIEQARQVAVDDPTYAQAQADIQRWSRVILDLAEGRAASGNFNAAIDAARLVPEDQLEVYTQAQGQIQRWEQRLVNRDLLQQAQTLLQPDQATSFQDAIALAQQIPPDYPEYSIAQERIEQWSRDILAIARARAAAGQLPGAISAASLVPPNSDAYIQAQQEIQRWQTAP